VLPSPLPADRGDVEQREVEENADHKARSGGRGQSVEAFGLLVACDLAMRTSGIRGLRTLAARVRRPSSASSTSNPLAAAEELAAIVERVAAFYYTQTWCLHRAAATACVLRRHGIRADVVIGFRTMPLHGHAWVEVGSTVIRDKPTVRSKFQVIDRF
jgi:hypothetical protein